MIPASWQVSMVSSSQVDDLDLADVGLAQQEHGQAGLADAAADGQGQLVVQQHLVEGQLRGGSSQPATVSWRSRAAASTRMPMEESSMARSSVASQNRMSPFRCPVVVVGGAAVVGLAGLQSLPPICMRKTAPWSLTAVVLPLLGGERRDTGPPAPGW